MRRGGKRLRRGLAERAPFSKKTTPPPMSCQRPWGRGKRGGGKQFEVIGNRKIIAQKSVTYVKFPHDLEENQNIYSTLDVHSRMEAVDQGKELDLI
jgi:hypothetical protein